MITPRCDVVIRPGKNETIEVFFAKYPEPELIRDIDSMCRGHNMTARHQSNGKTSIEVNPNYTFESVADGLKAVVAKFNKSVEVA